MNAYSGIRKVTERKEYEGLRDLWCRVFGDRPEFVDAFYRRFGSKPGTGETGDIEGYVICDGVRVVSALSLYRCGTMYIPEFYDEEGEGSMPRDDREFDGLPVYVTYAVCTDEEYRGKGLAGNLTEYVRNHVTEDLGGISIVSPAEPSLEDFYSFYGYRKGFFAFEGRAFTDMLVYEEDMFDEDDDFDIFDPGLSVVSCGAAVYNRYREAFLADTPHITLSDAMMEEVRDCSLNGDGLYVINGGDAVCVLSEAEDGNEGIMVSELLVNPMLADISEEIDVEIAARLAGYLEHEGLIYRVPGMGSCQSMYSSAADGKLTGYFGFPLE